MQIAFHNIKKKIGFDTALNDVSFTIPSNGIAGIFGDIGSGRSTILSLLAGDIQPDNGFITLDDQRVELNSRKISLHKGIGFISGSSRFLDNLKVEQYLYLAPAYLRPDKEKILNRFVQMNKFVDQKIIKDDLVGSLSTETKFLLEIIRQAALGLSTILLDEPFEYLGQFYREDFLKMLQYLKNDGYQIVFTSRQQEDILVTADYCLGLEKGVVKFSENAPIKQDLLLRLLDNRTNTSVEEKRNILNEKVLVLKSLKIDVESSALDFHLKRGEIVCFTGSPKEQIEKLSRICVGLVEPYEGSIVLNGFDLAGKPLRDFIQDGVGYLPFDQMENALAPELCILDHFDLVGKLSGFLYKSDQKRTNINQHLGNLEISYPSNTPVSWLSNRDRVKLLMGIQPGELALMVIRYPGRGMDKETTSWLWKEIAKRTAAGISILFISHDPEIIQSYADRVVVYEQGKWLEPMTAKEFSNYQSTLKVYDYSIEESHRYE